MLPSDIAFENSLAHLKFRSAQLRSIELFVFADGRNAVFDNYLPNAGLEEWIERKGAFGHSKTASGTPVVGGLRLILLPSSKSLGQSPFDAEDLWTLVEELNLPKAYVTDSACGKRRQYVVDFNRGRGNKGYGGMSMLLISPGFENNNMELAMSYDPATGITSGLLALAADAGGPVEKLLDDLVKSVQLAAHPLLLPALACNAWYEFMAHQFLAVHSQFKNNVQSNVGSIKDYFVSPQDTTRFKDFDVLDQKELQDRYDQIQRTIVLQHTYLSNALPYFMRDLSRELIGAFDKLGKGVRETQTDEGLRSYVQRLASRTEMEFNHREQLLAKVNIQMQVMHTLLQQRESRIHLQIAEETRRGSSALIVLAAITAVFLPLTAIAVIFSIAVTNATSTGSDPQTVIATNFPLFWAVAVPFVAAVILASILWANRKLLRRPRWRQPEKVTEKVTKV